jgi:aminoglycoside 3-N-acetyltransferase I
MWPAPAFSIRVLAPADVAAMRALLAPLGEAFGERETYGAEPPSTAYLERLLASDDFIAIAALKGTEVAGGLAAHVLRKFDP